MPGVTYAEGERRVPVRIQFGSRWRDTMIVGLPADSALRTLFDGGKTVDIAKCPEGHGKIKSPQCCGEDMSCAV